MKATKGAKCLLMLLRILFRFSRLQTSNVIFLSVCVWMDVAEINWTRHFQEAIPRPLGAC